MATPRRLTLPHASQILGATTVALARFIDRYNLSETLAENIKTLDIDNEQQTVVQLSEKEKEEFIDSAHSSALIDLGYAGFVCTWERYLKLYNLDRSTYQEGSTVFGLDKYSGAAGRAAFETDFPGAFIHEWVPKADKYWFASVLRNAFAHGQVSKGRRFWLYNIGPKGKTFEIAMNTQELARLIIDAITSFMRIVGPDQGYQPLTTMLNNYQTHYAKLDQLEGSRDWMG